MKKQYYAKYELKPARSPELPAEPPVSIPKFSGLGFLKNKFLNLKTDDILLLVLIFVMLTEDEPDYITIAALAFIFLS